MGAGSSNTTEWNNIDKWISQVKSEFMTNTGRPVLFEGMMRGDAGKDCAQFFIVTQ